MGWFEDAIARAPQRDWSDVRPEELGLEPTRPRRRRKARKTSLAGALRQARKAGVSVAGASIGPDGKVSLTFGDPSTASAINPWDEEIAKLGTNGGQKQ